VGPSMKWTCKTNIALLEMCETFFLFKQKKCYTVRE
jgi:hypothetical protein